MMNNRDPFRLHPEGVDLPREQQATLERPRMRYTMPARIFFWLMDFIYGKELVLPKIKLIEILARIPYHAWEIRAYWKLTFGYRDRDIRRKGESLAALGRLSQDNEYWHLITVVEKIEEDGIRENKFWFLFMPKLMAVGYAVFARTLATVNLNASFYFNAMFEDHAEHEYAKFVREHPELENQPIRSEYVKQTFGHEHWADVFRHIGLDERVHMNDSLSHCGRADQTVPYVSV